MGPGCHFGARLRPGSRARGADRALLDEQGLRPRYGMTAASSAGMPARHRLRSRSGALLLLGATTLFVARRAEADDNTPGCPPASAIELYDASGGSGTLLD